MMKKFKISGFDLGIIIAFAVITVIGAGAWWYLSGALSDAQTDVTSAKADFDKVAAVSTNPSTKLVVSEGNVKTLQTNIDQIKTQLVPVIQAQFKSKDNKLSLIRQEDPVAWKHDLDDLVHRLNAAAKGKNVTVPANYYFSFNRYLNASPNDEQTAVLSKQMLGVEQLTDVLINSQVKSITAIRRTYEEDPHSGATTGMTSEGGADHLAGYAVTAPGNVYIAYPFEVEFETNVENLRNVLTGLIQSPYVFLVRSLSVKNSAPNSPAINTLDQMIGTPPPSVIDTSPGEVAASPSTKGPQYLFGNSTLTVKMRVDMIEWTADPAAIADNSAAPAKGKGGKKGGP